MQRQKNQRFFVLTWLIFAGPVTCYELLMLHILIIIMYHVFLLHDVCVGRNLAIGEDNKCFIELNTKQVTDEQIQAIEQTCNDHIRSCIPVEPRWLQSDDPELDQVEQFIYVLIYEV